MTAQILTEAKNLLHEAIAKLTSIGHPLANKLHHDAAALETEARGDVHRVEADAKPVVAEAEHDAKALETEAQADVKDATKQG